MTRRSALLFWVAAPVRPAPLTDNQLLEHDVNSFVTAFNGWTSKLLNGINDLKAGEKVVSKWPAVRKWLPER
jgi:hypothetical protein